MIFFVSIHFVNLDIEIYWRFLCHLVTMFVKHLTWAGKTLILKMNKLLILIG